MAGTLGVVCLVLAFFGLSVLPVNAVGLLLVLVAFGLFLAEAWFVLLLLLPLTIWSVNTFATRVRKRLSSAAEPPLPEEPHGTTVPGT